MEQGCRTGNGHLGPWLRPKGQTPWAVAVGPDHGHFKPQLRTKAQIPWTTSAGPGYRYLGSGLQDQAQTLWTMASGPGDRHLALDDAFWGWSTQKSKARGISPTERHPQQHPRRRSKGMDLVGSLQVLKLSVASLAPLLPPQHSVARVPQ